MNDRRKSELELELNNRLIFQTAALGLLLIASNITGITGVNGVQVSPAFSVPAAVKAEAVSGTEELLKEKEEPSVKDNGQAMTVEEYVRNYFSDIPILIEIARCESRFRQYDSEGGVLRGQENSLDRGVMQINEYYHGEDSDKLGFDILTLEGNTAYARYIFERYGVSPWYPSYPCWGKTAAYAAYSELAVK